MTFEHLPIGNLPKVELEEVDGKHYYLCDGNVYPSVTTILDDTADKFNLDRWRIKVGADVAAHISKTSSDIGTAAHKFNEAYLNNHELSYEAGEHTLYGKAHHINMLPYLDQIGTIHGTEVRLVSKKHGFAGTVDCIGEYMTPEGLESYRQNPWMGGRHRGIVSVIDFKCKSKPQDKRWMKDHFLQVAAYAMAWEEMTGMKIDQGIILASNRHGTMQQFIVRFGRHGSDFLDRLARYKNNNRPVRKGIRVP